MGGSIRIPAAFNGVVGLMVSANRLPSLGQMAYLFIHLVNIVLDFQD